MSKWPLVRLGDVATVVSGTTPSTTVAEYWDGEYNWVTPAEINDGTIVVDKTQRKITALAIANCGLKSFPAGTVLLSSRAPIGKVAIAGTEMFCNQGFKNLICGELIYNKYLFWYLKYKKDYLNSLGRGATFKEISKTIVENVQVPLPPLEVQKKIAQTLDAAAELIALRKKQLAELDNLVKAVFYDMFGDPVKNEKGWIKDSLENHLEKIDGGWSPKCHDYPATDGIWGVLKLSAVTGGEYKETENKALPNEITPQESLEVHPSDLLFTRKNTRELVGACAYVFETQLRLMIPDIIFRLVTKPSVNRIYLWKLFNNKSFRSQIERLANGSAGSMPNISKGRLALLSIPLPPLALQNQFAVIVTKIEEQKALVEKAIDESQYLFDSLMDEYFG